MMSTRNDKRFDYTINYFFDGLFRFSGKAKDYLSSVAPMRWRASITGNRLAKKIFQENALLPVLILPPRQEVIQ